MGSASTERVGEGQVGGCTQRVQTAWPHLGSSLEVTWWAISVLFGINGARNKRSHLVGPPFPEFKACYSATTGLHFSRDLSRCMLIGGCSQSHVSVKNHSGSTFEPNNPTEQKLGYV